MKILMVLEREFPEDERVEKEALSLIKAGHEVHLACFTRQNRTSEEIFKGIHIHRKPISNFILKKASVAALKIPLYFKFWKDFLFEINKKEKFEVLHIHDLPLARVGYEVAKKIKAKWVLDLHENWAGLLSVSEHTKTFLGRILSSNSEWEAYETRYCNVADQIIVVVEEAKDRLVKKGIFKYKIAVVSNTISIPFEVKEKEIYNPFTFIYAGGITYHRGLQYVLEGLALVNQSFSDWQLVLVGAGRYVENLKKQAKELKIDNKVLFLGHQPYEKMMHFLAGADCCLIPHVKSSHTDHTIPNKLFQYMYLKKPVLASNCDPIERIVKECQSGLIYDFDNPEQFSEKALEIIQNKENHFGENGHQKVIEKYNWSKEETILVQHYDNLKKNII
ncbi:1,2-diacylglycerol 3-alpha-glucosyltransferase [Flavobacteriaceae bacterium UJ101]|nr:1,2-diacylglycerol 3-alpha-glucosyltransferase [Flavobacteriaceae bacterium UJ101]